VLDFLLLIQNKFQVVGIQLGIGASIDVIAVHLELREHNFENFLVLVYFLYQLVIHGFEFDALVLKLSRLSLLDLESLIQFAHRGGSDIVGRWFLVLGDASSWRQASIVYLSELTVIKLDKLVF
jgi:hypothetical protein